MAKILLGVSGGIAAYKAVEFVRLATAAGHSVRVLMTSSARRFIGVDTFEGILGAPVLTSEFERDPMRGAFPGEEPPLHEPIGHLAVAEACDVFLVAPASANTIAKLASGQADSILTTAFLATQAPRLVAPAMNERMYLADATQSNLDTLRGFGVDVIEPGTGRLASKGEVGIGRLPDPAELLERVESALASSAPGTGNGSRQIVPKTVASSASDLPRDLTGLKVLVTAGGTREAIDPVRYIGNRSSGRMGFALAERAAARGAEVTVIAANVSLTTPDRVTRIDVESTADLAKSCEESFHGSDLLLMAAAPADFTVAGSSDEKISRSGGEFTLSLVPTEDILAALTASRSEGQTVVGFAAQFGGDAIGRAREKLETKGADMIVLNDVSDASIGFDSSENAVTLVTAGDEITVEKAAKTEVADRILDRVLEIRRAGT